MPVVNAMNVIFKESDNFDINRLVSDDYQYVSRQVFASETVYQLEKQRIFEVVGYFGPNSYMTSFLLKIFCQGINQNSQKQKTNHCQQCYPVRQ